MKTEDNVPNWTEPDKDGNINIPDELDPLFNKLGMQMRFHTISGKNELQTVVDMTYIADKFYSEKIKAIDELVSEKINTQQEIINSQQEEIKDLTETNNKFHSRINEDREIKDLLRSQVKGLLDGLDEIYESSNGIGVLNQIWVNNFVKELYEKYKK
jgi:hypothetical protein